jgi:hypothetical protein
LAADFIEAASTPVSPGAAYEALLAENLEEEAPAREKVEEEAPARENVEEEAPAPHAAYEALLLAGDFDEVPSPPAHTAYEALLLAESLDDPMVLEPDPLPSPSPRAVYEALREDSDADSDDSMGSAPHGRWSAEDFDAVDVPEEYM